MHESILFVVSVAFPPVSVSIRGEAVVGSFRIRTDTAMNELSLFVVSVAFPRVSVSIRGKAVVGSY